MSAHFTDLFVAGHWRASSDGKVLRVTDPATGNEIAQMANASVEDCIEAVYAAAAAATSWAATSPRARAEILSGAFELMTAEREQVAKPVVTENGKSWADALGEVDYAAEFFRWYAEEAVCIRGDSGSLRTGTSTFSSPTNSLGCPSW